MIKIRKVLLLLGFCGFFLSGSTAWAKSWYVRSATACANNGDGTASNCAASAGAAGGWKGFSNIVWGSVVAGDTLNLVTGDTYTGPLLIGSSGSAGNPVTITVSGGGTANIDANAGTAINFQSHSYVTLDGVIGSPAFGGSTTMGIAVTNIGASNYCVYQNGAGADNNKVLHISCHGTSTTSPDDNRGGMYLSGGNGWEVAYNYIYGDTYPAYSASKWHATCLSLFRTAQSSASFTDNTAHDNNCTQMYHDGLRCNGNCSLYHNEVSHIDGSGHADSILIQSGSYGQIYSNYVHDSGDQNIYLDNLYDSVCHHIRVYNNIIDSNPGHGMNMDPEGAAGTAPASTGCTGSGASGWDDIEFINNTIYSTSTYGIYWSGRGTVANLVVLNNIFGTDTTSGYYMANLRSSTSVTFTDANSWDYNVYSTSAVSYSRVASWGSSNTYTLAQLQALSPARETHGKAGIPTYVNANGADFHLANSDTVAKGAGVNLYLTYAFLQTDKDGNSRPSSGSWDIGAYRVATGPQPTPPANLSATVQ